MQDLEYKYIAMSEHTIIADKLEAVEQELAEVEAEEDFRERQKEDQRQYVEEKDKRQM